MCKVLRMFVHILTTDDKYYLLNRENLRQPIQIQLYWKEKTFSQLDSAFSKAMLNFQHFLKRDLLHS